MALPLEQIDTSLTEDLMGLKRDREVLAARLARMTTEVDKVSTPVFERVRADYQSRLAELDRRAEPQKDQARREYAKLRNVLEEVATQRATALQDQEELEFRHRLGEFEDSDFAAKNTEVAQRLAGLERELAAISAVRDRFVAAFDSEAELTQPPAAAAPVESSVAPADAPRAVPPATSASTASPAQPADAPEPEPAEPAPPTRSGKQRTVTTVNATAASGTGSGAQQAGVAGGSGAQQAAFSPEAAAAPLTAPPADAANAANAANAADTPPAASASVQPLPQPPEDGDSTITAARPNRRPGQDTEAPPPIPLPLGAGTVVLTDLDQIAAAVSTDPALGGTLIVAFGRLVPLDPADADAVEFRVQPFTTIGRTRQNNIQLDAPSVSRKHAQIALTENGYMVRDLGSENGTFVNGERVAERLLADGDHLQFGGVRFSFHTTS